QDEIGRYYDSESYISHTDSKANLVDKLYHIVKGYSIKKKYRSILKHKKEAKLLLDIGSGTGDFLKAAQHYGISSMGTEPNEQSRHLSIAKGRTLVPDLDPITDQIFDVMTLWHVLGHMYEPRTYFQNVDILLNREGLLLIAVPNYPSYDSKYYYEHWAAYDVP